MYKAFIVDDEQMIVKGLTKLINWKQLGFELVGSAFNGKSALERITDLDPHVVVSDIQLGDITGLELIESIHKTHPQILFIFISGHDDFSYCQQAISKGAVDYILKPINMEYLSTILDKCNHLIENQLILDSADRISFVAKQQESENESDVKLIEKIKAYIDMNYYENIDIASIADKFFIGQTYFSELFKKEFGINFKKYLTQIRMEKAKLYIIDNKFKISGIATRVGFDDPGYFSQVFRKYTGMTPREFKLKINTEGESSEKKD